MERKQSAPSCTLPTRDQAQNLGMYPDWKSNRQPFGTVGQINHGTVPNQLSHICQDIWGKCLTFHRFFFPPSREKMSSFYFYVQYSPYPSALLCIWFREHLVTEQEIEIWGCLDDILILPSEFFMLWLWHFFKGVVNAWDIRHPFYCMSLHSFIYPVDKYLFCLALCWALRVGQRPRHSSCLKNTFIVMVETNQKK